MVKVKLVPAMPGRFVTVPQLDAVKESDDCNSNPPRWWSTKARRAAGQLFDIERVMNLHRREASTRMAHCPDKRRLNHAVSESAIGITRRALHDVPDRMRMNGDGPM